MGLNSKWTWIFIMNKTKLSCTQTNMIIYTVPKFLDVWSRRLFKSFWVRHQISEALYQTQTVKIVENGLQNIEITIIFEFMVNWSTIIKNSNSLSPILWDLAQRKTIRSIWSSDSGHEKCDVSKRPVKRFSAKVIFRVTDP